MIWAIPAGACSDIVDRRRFLLGGELFIMARSIVFAVLVARHLITPSSLLLMTFMVSVGSAVTAPEDNTSDRSDPTRVKA